MRLVHISDIHLDTSFASEGIPPEIADVVRHSLKSCFASILEDAQEWSADAVLIAGDLFEHEHVSFRTIKYVSDLFESIAPIPVFISPGNRDPRRKDSPYNLDSWPPNVYIMDRPDWQEITLPDLSLVIHGFAFDDFHISRNPFQSMPRITADGRTHIMLCHGTEVGHIPSSAKNHAPLDAALLPSELSYCALGHFHERTDASALGSPPVWYPGVPQPFRFGQTSGSYLRITIDNGQADVEPVNTKNLPLRTHTHKLEAGHSIDALTTQLRETGNGCILALSLTGSWPTTERSDISARIATLRQEGFLIYITDWNVAERSDYGDLEARQDALGDFCVSVADELKDAPAEEQAALIRARDMGIATLSNPTLPLVPMGGEG